MNSEELIRIFRNIAEREFNYNRHELPGIVKILNQTLRRRIPRPENDAPEAELSSKDEEFVDYCHLIVTTLSIINMISDGLNNYIKNFGLRINYIYRPI